MLYNVIVFTITILLQLQLASVEQGFVPNVPETCQLLSYCNQTQPDYPEAHVERLIKTLGIQNANQSMVDSIKPTRRLDPLEVELCAFVEQELIPKVAQNTDGTWNFIINSKLHYRQMYLVEICNKSDDPCSPVAYFHPGYSASCQQNYITKLMLALDHNGKKVEKKFKLPSNCYCQVKQDTNWNSEGVKSLRSDLLAKKYHKNSMVRP